MRITEWKGLKNAMDLLIDTNIFLDVAFDRPGNEEVRQLFLKMEEEGDNAFLTASAVTDLFYIIRKKLHDVKKTYKAMGKILNIVNILLVNEYDILTAFHAGWRDFEDCVQFVVALHQRMDYIITRNVMDFEDNSIPVISPVEYILRNR